MADYYTHFSIVMKLPDVAAQQYALALHAKAESLTSGDEVPGEIPTELHDNLDMWIFETEPGGNELEPTIWMHSENGGIDAVCDFIQHLLKKFTPQGYVAFEWANDCSKPRTDAYGGGAAFITAQEIYSMTTYEWINNLINKHSKQQCLTPVT
jgi:hypothetical protein